MTEKSLFWADQVAADVVKQWAVPSYRTEMGIGASGIPHIGSAGDGVRSYAVALGIRALGKESELIAYSDDQDGLRKVPEGFPPGLEEEIGKPVSRIPDPFGCHGSFALHVSSLLTEAFEKLGVAFSLRRGSEEYRKGTLDREVREILTHWKKAGEIIREVTGSGKFLDRLPFLPICQSCGRVYTTRALEFLPREKAVRYACDQEFVGKASGREVLVKGCGSSGKVGIREGKLAWKVEFAARWKALDIHFESYGKDILDSVRCNDRICREILGRDPPVHAFYELFTERGGRKISKSKGNVFTPQRWLEVASPESLRLLFLKRLGMSRVVDLDAIPAFMDEVDALEKLYFGKIREENERELAHKKRLFEFVHFLQPPKSPGLTMGYQSLASLASSLPAEGREAVVRKLLLESGALGKPGSEGSEQLRKRIAYASRFAGAEKVSSLKLTLSPQEKKALAHLLEALNAPGSAEEIQQAAFSAAKSQGIPAGKFFPLLYRILLGTDSGPKAGHLIEALGRERVRGLLQARLRKK